MPSHSGTMPISFTTDLQLQKKSSLVEIGGTDNTMREQTGYASGKQYESRVVKPGDHFGKG